MSINDPHEAQGRVSQQSEVENSSKSTLEDTGLVKEEWSIPFEDLVLESPIGEGSFGKGNKNHFAFSPSIISLYILLQIQTVIFNVQISSFQLLKAIILAPKLLSKNYLTTMIKRCKNTSKENLQL